MSLLDREMYHGAALAQIVESGGGASIRKASRAFGHYEIESGYFSAGRGRRLLIRHSSAAAGPWRFVLRPKELALLRADQSDGCDVFVCLVCGTEAICVLTAVQIRQVVALDAAAPQSIRVYARPHASIHVAGSAGELPGAIPKHAFPGNLFR